MSGVSDDLRGGAATGDGAAAGCVFGTDTVGFVPGEEGAWAAAIGAGDGGAATRGGGAAAGVDGAGVPAGVTTLGAAAAALSGDTSVASDGSAAGVADAVDRIIGNVAMPATSFIAAAASLSAAANSSADWNRCAGSFSRQRSAIASSDGGINCGATCIHKYPKGTTVTLIPVTQLDIAEIGDDYTIAARRRRWFLVGELMLAE